MAVGEGVLEPLGAFRSANATPEGEVLEPAGSPDAVVFLARDRGHGERLARRPGGDSYYHRASP